MWTMSKELARIKDFRAKASSSTNKQEKIKFLTSISSIVNHDVKAEIRDIIRNIANNWGITPESLDIDYNTSLDHTEDNISDAYNYHAKFSSHRGFNDPFDINITITNPKHNSLSTTITSHVFDTETQKDNLPLVDHMTFEVNHNKNGFYNVSAKFRDFPSTLITFQINELIDEEINPKNPTCQAIISAVDDRILRNSSIML